MQKASVLTVLALVAFSACASDVPEASAPPSIIKASATPTPTVVPTSAKPVATPKPDVLEVGDTFVGKTARITLQKIDMKIDDGDEPDMQGALIKTCILKLNDGEDSTTLGWSPWTMRDDDDGRYPDNGTSGGNLPTPVYPNGNETYAVGDCAKGWIFFSAGKAKITKIQYENDRGDKAAWLL